MRILHLLYESEGDAFGIGGVGTRAYAIYRCLKDRHAITLLCKKYPGAKDGEINGIPHVFAGRESKSLAVALFSYACHAARFVRRHGNEFDIIIEEFSPAIPTFLPAFAKRPVVLQVQGYTGALYFRKYNPISAAILCGLERWRPVQYRNYIFVSGETRKRLRAEGRGHAAVIPNGIDTELLGLPEGGGEYILYLGRIDVYGKGLDLLLSAYRTIAASGPVPGLVIAGDGRDRAHLEKMIKELPEPVRQQVVLPGWVKGPGKTEVLGKAIFAVFPSRHEVQPIAALEAMAAGRPLVVSDIPEFGFVTAQGAGKSFRSGDADSLARAMTEMLNDKELIRFGRLGREGVRDLTWERIAEQYEEFLQTAAGHH